MALVRFSAAEDEQLIEFVSSRKFLWNMKDTSFKNVMKKDATWTEIGKLLNKTKCECQKRWKSIRDHYKRQRKEERSAVLGSAATKKRASYWDRLQFLDTVEDERDSFSNVVPESSEINSEGACSSIQINSSSVADSGLLTKESYTLLDNSKPVQEEYSAKVRPPPSKKKKENPSLLKYLADKKEDRAHFKNCLQELMKPSPQEDDVDMFFRTMALTVKKFRPHLVTQAKMNVFKAVIDLEILNQQTQFTNTFTSNYNEALTGESSMSSPHTPDSVPSHTSDV